MSFRLDKNEGVPQVRDLEVSCLPEWQRTQAKLTDFARVDTQRLY